MCGIVFLKGVNAANRIGSCIDKLQHRGPDDINIWENHSVAMGFARLAINGVGSDGLQPQIHGDWISSINGEIYNYKELIDRYDFLKDSCNDTCIVLPLFEKLGNAFIDIIDGFYSAVFYNRESQELIVLRDFMGKKPLFFGQSNSEFFVISELKALDSIDWFEQVPMGLSLIDLDALEIIKTHYHQPKKPENNLFLTLQKSVKKRLPIPEQKMGVFLSGGLDSSIIASIVAKHHKNVTYFTLGEKDSADHIMVDKVVKSLGLTSVITVPTPTSEELEAYISSVVYTTESYNPSIVSNGLATYLLAQAAKREGIKVVLTGEGADEIFGGYFKHLKSDDLINIRKQLIMDMHFTELRRLDLCSMAHGVETRCPYLDSDVLALSDYLGYEEVFRDGLNKIILRDNFRNELPIEIIERPKMSFDVGSGIRAMVVKYLRSNGRSEREELYDIWRSHFSYKSRHRYFYCYPVFDDAIDFRGIKHR